MKYLSKSGVGIYTDYRENVIVDPDNPILKWKADKKKERLPDGSPYIASENSEDILSWNVFVSLQRAGKLSLITSLIQVPQCEEELYFWQHAISQQSQDIDHEIQFVLDEIEPWGRNAESQQTETDIILRGRSHIVMVESKLGKPNQIVKAWVRGGSQSRTMRPEYLKVMQQLGPKLFNDSFDFQQDGRQFYQLFRNYLLGATLSAKWNTTFSFLAIVNGLNHNLERRSHREEFQHFQSKLVQPSNTFLITWQEIWNVLLQDSGLSGLKKWLLKHPLLRLNSLTN